MKAIIVDDEYFCIKYLKELCEEINDLEIVATFSIASDMLSYITDHQVDIIFMDIEMPALLGIHAVYEINKMRSNIGVIFVTGYDEYAMEAFRVDAVDYILKPYGIEDIKKAVEKAQKLSSVTIKKIEIQTFGHFGVFINGRPYRFSNAKAKELLALLIDQKGAVMDMQQAITYLWEDRPYDEKVKQLYRKAVIYLHHLVSETGVDFFISNRGSCYIVPSLLNCDYFRLLDGSKEEFRKYCGEYLVDYSWAEESIAKIEKFIQFYNENNMDH